jgi:hypothetical protein
LEDLPCLYKKQSSSSWALGIYRRNKVVALSWHIPIFIVIMVSGFYTHYLGGKSGDDHPDQVIILTR